MSERRSSRPDELGVELCWGTAQAASVTELITAAAEAGFSGVTVSPPMYADALARGLGDEVRALIASLGVRVTILDPVIGPLPGTPGPSDVPPARRPVFSFTEQDCLRMAWGLCVDAINLPHSLGSPKPLGELIDAFGGVCIRAGGLGLDVMLEFVPSTGVPDLATALAIVRGVKLPNAKVMFDIWHFARSRGEMGDLKALPADIVGGIQVSDRASDHEEEEYVPLSGRLLPGDGDLPLAEMLSLLFATSPSAHMGVEVFSDEMRALPPAEAARRAMSSIRRVLQETHATRTSGGGR